jgi:hypothetical protein
MLIAVYSIFKFLQNSGFIKVLVFQIQEMFKKSIRNPGNQPMKEMQGGWVWWLIPIIPATQEAELKRIVVPS